MIGNFIADHIKGNQFSHFNSQIKLGIKLHREIDTFTDTHEITRISKRRLHKRYGLFAGIIIDIFYDHYLAKNWSDYSNIPLEEYIQNFYKTLNENFEISAITEDNIIMAINHKKYPLYGIQFHPESIKTSFGNVIFKNFLKIK